MGQFPSVGWVNFRAARPPTDEFLVSAEHALVPEFVVGVNLTYRKASKYYEQDQLVFDGPNPGIPGDGHD